MEQPEGNDMRKIEKAMVAAVREQRNWRSGNTAVIQYPDCRVCEVVLHGNVIATVQYAPYTVRTALATLRRWPTPTTKSRLRALGVGVTTEAGETFIDGVNIREAV